MANENIIGNTSQETSTVEPSIFKNKMLEKTAAYGSREVPGVAKGARPPERQPTVVNVFDVTGKQIGKDYRVKIMIPDNYWTNYTVGPFDELYNLGGIVFPYTPSINVEFKAEYASQTPLHSNFAINFYQRSSVGAISISGKFTVSNDRDAAIYLSTVHLLKALTRMRSGGKTGDPDSGSPPPVCRLFGHGEWMFENVPVAITSFRLDLPDSVDYYTMPAGDKFTETSVPIISTIQINCLPMYSRNEMLKFNVTEYLDNSSNFKKQGFI